MTSRGANSLAWLIAALALFAASGATCHRPLVNPFASAGPAAPQILPEGATREQIIAAVNQYSARIQSLSVTGATITTPDSFGLPILSGNIAAERPGRFRLTAGTAISGQELDLGSNDEMFWMWVGRSQPPAIYFCRHDQFANSNIRQVMPVEPSWLLAALGIIDIDPASVYHGPLPHGDGKVVLHTWLHSSTGPLLRVLVIDPVRALVTEQYIYDAGGTTLLASAVVESHRYYELQQVALPSRLRISLPPADLTLRIDLGTVAVNQLAGDPRQLWSMPVIQGVPQYDLGGAVPGTPLPGSLTPQPVLPPATPPSYVPAPLSPSSAPVSIYQQPAGNATTPNQQSAGFSTATRPY